MVITGPAGVGKSTIRQQVVQRTGAMYSVSATTRQPRAGEADGRDYDFVDRPAFERMIEAGELLEWAEVFGNLYGTPAGPVTEAERAGRIVILEIDVQGGLQVYERRPDATFILVLPPSIEELERRLRGRGSEDEASAARRLAKAKEEIRAAEQSGAYKYTVVNDDLATAVERVVGIVNQESGGK